MSSRLSLAAALREIEEQVRGLRIRAEEEAERGQPGAAPHPWTTAWEEQLIAAQTAEQIVAVDLSPLDSLQRTRGHLTTAGGWDERARLGRALRSGVIAKRCLISGDYKTEPLPSSLPLRTTIFVCLHCPGYRQGFWSRRNRPFLELVGDPAGRGIGPEVPHSVLQGHLKHFCYVPAFQQADLGHFGEKFDALRRSLQELPQKVDVDLSVLLQEIKVGFDTYAKYESPHFAAPKDETSEVHDEITPKHVTAPNLGHKPVTASRIKWKHPPSFDPRPYLLDPVTKAVFNDPGTLRLPQADWPDKPKARVQCSRPELLKLIKLWDAHKSSAQFPCRDIDSHETVGLFSVPKDQSFDRLIINPTVINSRMMPYSSYTKRLAPGSLLALLTLKPKEAFRFCADDLSDFYYTFKVPPAGAKRNCIGARVYESEVKHLSCYNPSTPGPYYPALATLAMGDGHAVEIAQSAFSSLKRVACVMVRSLSIDGPFPEETLWDC